MYSGANCQATQSIVEAADMNGVLATFVNSRGTAVPITGIPTKFTKRSGDASMPVSQAEFNAFFETTRRVTQKLSMQLGLRYQAQQHLRDYNNFSPRLNFRYQLRPTTILNAGGGIIYNQEGFSIGNFESLLRNDGTARQFETLVTNAPFSPWNVPDSIGIATGITTTIRTKAPDFVAPYSIRSQIGIDQRITNQMGFNITYDVNRGLHQLRTRNVNAPLPDIFPLDRKSVV